MRRAARTSLAPAPARDSASTLPMPALAPVITTFISRRLRVMRMIMAHVHRNCREGAECDRRGAGPDVSPAHARARLARREARREHRGQWRLPHDRGDGAF